MCARASCVRGREGGGGGGECMHRHLTSVLSFSTFSFQVSSRAFLSRSLTPVCVRVSVFGVLKTVTLHRVSCRIIQSPSIPLNRTHQ